MLNYEGLKENHGTKIGQTIDSPILVFDYFTLSEIFTALLVVLMFGVVFYSWGLMFLILFLVLGVGPFVRRRYHRGIFFHWPYRKFHMALPGIVNPKGRRKFSD